jgi:hypothetical protein
MSITREDIQKAERALEKLKASRSGTAESLLYSIVASELEEAKKRLPAEKPEPTIARQYTTDEIKAAETMLEVFKAKEDPTISPEEMAKKFPDFVRPVGSFFGAHMFTLKIKNPFIKQLLEDSDSVSDFKKQLEKIVASKPVQRDNIVVDTNDIMPPLEEVDRDETIATLLQALEAETAKREEAEFTAAKFKSYQAEKDSRIAKLETKLATYEGEVARLHKLIKTLEGTNVARAREVEQLTTALNQSNREKVVLAESKDKYFNKYEQTLARVHELEAELMKRPVASRRTHIVQQPTACEPTPCCAPVLPASSNASACTSASSCAPAKCTPANPFASATASADTKPSVSDKAVAEANGVDVVLQLLQRLKNARNM